jgi:hypothetical protein
MTSLTSRSHDTKIQQFERAIASVEGAYQRESAGLDPWSKLDSKRTGNSEPDSLLHLQNGLRIVAASLQLACNLAEYHGAAAQISAAMQSKMDSEMAGIDSALASIGLDGSLLRNNVELNRKGHDQAQKSYLKKVEALGELMSILSKRYWEIIGPRKSLEGGKFVGYC